MAEHINRYTRIGLAVFSALLAFGLINGMTSASPPDPDIDYPPLPEIDMSMSPTRLTAQTQPASLPDPADPITIPDPAWRIGVVTDGLYALDYALLNAAGVPVTTADPEDYRLFWRGQEVALDASDVGGTFEPGEAFYFYGEKFHGSTQEEKYTDENVYWLTVDETKSGLRMATRDVTPSEAVNRLHWYTETLHMEKNLIWWSRWSTAPGTDATWFWEDWTVGEPEPITYTFELSDLAMSSYDAMLSVELAGRSINAHNVNFIINDVVVGDVSWYGEIGHQTALTFPANALQEGQNTLTMTILTNGTVQRIYLNWFELQYRRQTVAQEDVLTWEFADEQAFNHYQVYLPLAIRAGGTQTAVNHNAKTKPISIQTSTSTTYTVEARGFTSNDLLFYDVTNPHQPVKLLGETVDNVDGYRAQFVDAAPVGTTYHATKRASILSPISVISHTLVDNWLSPNEGADLIVIAPRNFFAAVEPLVEHRRNQGLRVQLVDIEDVYALFNGGIVHPEAVRAFVSYAHTNWPGPPPQYLLLVGDASFNLKGYNEATYGTWTPPVIPPYLDFIDPIQGEVPVDAYFGDTTGDGMPELAVGRIPAYDSETVKGFVDKILTYEDRKSATWMNRALFVADDGEDFIEGFATTLDNLMADYVPAALTTDTVYIQDYCGISGDCPAATEALTQTWGQGAALLTYAGHGSIHRWAHEPLLFNEEVATLPTMDGLPFIISLDCWDGYWIFPPIYPPLGNRDVRSVGEWATTVLTDRGAIGIFGPAGLGYLYLEDPMAKAMYDGMFNHGVFRIGDITQLGRQAIPGSYLARSYTLLGDPTLVLPWWETLTINPSVITVTTGSNVSLPSTVSVSGTARFGKTFTVTPTWTASSGEVDSEGIYTTPNTAQQTTIIAYIGQVSTTLKVDVVTSAEP